MPTFRSPQRIAAAAFAAAAALPFSAQAEMVPIAWDSAGRFVHEARVPPGKFVELCEKLPAGSSVQWSFEAGGPLNFNVHYHEGKQVQYPTRLDNAANGQGALKAAIDQDYCWMWSNKAAAEVLLKLRLERR
ncbi:MAG TPA: hypothetical protein VGE16_16870 [Albitalea sp.]